MMEDWPEERLIKQSEMIQKHSSEKAVKKQMKEVKMSIVGKGKENIFEKRLEGISQRLGIHYQSGILEIQALLQLKQLHG